MKGHAPEQLVEKLLFSKRDAAFALSISVRSIDYLIANKRLAVRRVGKRTLIAATELRRFAAANHYEPVSG